jgi:hypothetical protein
MTGEEMGRAIEFLLENQATLEARVTYCSRVSGPDGMAYMACFPRMLRASANRLRSLAAGVPL